uniref:Chromate efflux transporter n=1 Tax=Desulfobacca acetoxidans TaxID=60893 RepID=A0A7V4LCG0_9BACT
MPTITGIFATFLHLGCTAFGGLAMIEPMRRRLVQEKGWLSQQEFMDGVALCQVIPGATVVQLATYVGQRLRGPAGALAGAAGFILPAFVFMTTLTWLYVRYGHLVWVKSLSQGLNAAVIALLLQALWRLGRGAWRSWLDLTLAVLTFGALWLRWDYLAVFLGAGVVRLCLKPREGAVTPAPDSGPAAAGMRREIAVLLAVLVMAGAAWAACRVWQPVLAQLAGLMAKVGVISFGGGYVMIPVLQWEVVERLRWLTLPQFLDGILLSYVTPGPLIILAAFTGFLVQGLKGAAVATTAIFLPPILIVVGLTPLYQQVKSAWWMRPLIQGVLAALLGMLALAIWQMALVTLTGIKTWALMLGAAVSLVVFEVNLLWVIAAVAALSLWLF